MFQITTGDDWAAVVRPVTDEHPWAYVFFVVYIVRRDLHRAEPVHRGGRRGAREGDRRGPATSWRTRSRRRCDASTTQADPRVDRRPQEPGRRAGVAALPRDEPRPRGAASSPSAPSSSSSCPTRPSWPRWSSRRSTGRSWSGWASVPRSPCRRRSRCCWATRRRSCRTTSSGSVAMVLFLAGAVVLFREGRNHQQDSGEEYVADAKDVTGFRAVVASFVVLFAAEWGDLSQLLTISLVARYEAPLSVFIGALGRAARRQRPRRAGRTHAAAVRRAARPALRRRRRLPAPRDAHARRASLR